MKTVGPNDLTTPTIAIRLAQEGARLAIADIDTEAADRLARRLQDQGAEALSGRVDVSLTADVAAFLDATVRRFGRLEWWNREPAP
jgi:NAD(P)-dependent dehydrogenase (short-subunit alcohol dehydrogenase family)